MTVELTHRPHRNRAWFLIVPAMVVVGFVALIPVIAVVNFSVQDVFFGNTFVWVGSRWFEEVLRSEPFRATLLRSLLYAALVLLIEIPLGVAIALRLPRSGARVTLFLVIIAIPLLIPWFVVGVIWKVLIDGQIGLLGVPLSTFVPGFSLDDTIWAWVVILVMDVWHWTGLVVLLCYAGLTAIPHAFYQAAGIDGASRWAVFRFIELPKMSRVLMIAVLLRAMDSLMIYIEPFMITRGGPGVDTTFVSLDLLQTATVQFDFGEASAQSIIYFLIMVTLSWTLYTTMVRRSV